MAASQPREPQFGDALRRVVEHRPVGPDEGLLGEVLGIGRPLGRAQRDPVDQVLVVSHELGEGPGEVIGQPARAISAHAEKNTPRSSSVAVCRLRPAAWEEPCVG